MLTQQKLQRWYFAWENLQWGFCDVGCCFSFIFCSSFCCCSSFMSRLLCHATITPPWLLRPVGASTGSGLCPGYLCFFVWGGHYGFGWAFFTHRRFFALRYLPDIFLRLSRPPWGPRVLLWDLKAFMLILRVQAWPIWLFDSQQSMIFIFRSIRF